jgi:tetratricopeptide (TPR) repeat protein
VADGAAGEGARYWAFISYSHRDAAFGRSLHRRLENYVLPRRLVGRAVAGSVVPRRLAPIFRDREEFAAAHDLSAEVRAALKASRSLIVVCSPQAAASQWVGREVEVFRELHPDAPVLAAVRAGEPADCFPTALRRVGANGVEIEPLAADFRRGRDGEHLGLLKLVAGVLDLGLDELVQRDAHRRHQRVTAVTAAALALALVMSLLTLFAVNARSEAERQRGEAEGLVEFMLTDLRTRLKGVGRLDVMTAVNERALKYYSDKDLSALPVDSLERRARIFHAMGEDDETRGNLDAALAKFREARRTTAALLAQAPNDPERIFDQAQNEFYVALVDWRRNRFDAAQAGFERYAALVGRLLSINPANPDWQMEAGYAESNIATLTLRDKSDPTSAQKHFAAALDHFETALRAKPDDPDILSDIADGYAWLADCERALRLFDGARSDRAREQRILNSLLKKDPQNAEYARDLLGNALGFAHIDLDQERWSAAASRLETAYFDAKRLAAADPANGKLAKQEIALGLFLAKAMIRGNLSPPAKIRILLSDCAGQTARSDQELRDFCAVISVEAASAEGRTNQAASDYLRANHDRMQRIRHSPRWGIDFHDE